MASASAVTSLSEATSGNGATVDFLTAVSRVSMIMTKSGTVTGGVAAVEVSHDGVSWRQRHTFRVKRPPVIGADFTEGGYRYWRVSILVSVTGGGAVTATFMEADG